ncbi:MAG: Holliday junction branch migration protein RuvA [Clostridium sp.]|uniref:Holliday junction branch migration protein RuvA n=1 Tax=Clostridium sp. TaxID=1506 RepID=UPI0025BC253E|nr:Holliday junction branch migration protein RuvA [Clostridium sp.]MCH3962881.1 Holliday junction branch migration protein RuvA [Clostridium sp.]MCI1715704.1 Holliday junction branch migration protein RuvA [Clostridium sp.]MCI1800091.1 Holliday junction branch migration protein RuvA [Clostridium sp.]MCI1814005.1 Holliday junction branch migration protein RuvA [Clostridium sp.]MCI1870903.1 Holliday junction branch migration protein RuvA [Clostridium sp.]
MYEYIIGIYRGINRDYIIVENNGIGYRINTSGSTIANLPKIGDDIMVYVMQIVREDFIGLYGFLTKEELSMFNLLLGVNGIGARAALSLLSITSVNNLKYSIVIGDEKTIIRAPGVGKKTAQRIILELKDKMDSKEIDGRDGYSTFEKENSENNISEALEALVSLGYSEKEASRALHSIDRNSSVEDIIKEALKFLMG